MTKDLEEARKENIKKAQETWKNMPKSERSRRQPEGQTRTKPGKGEDGDYYHIEVRDKNQFSSFRTHDIGSEGHSMRVAGHRPSGSWDTQKWLINKNDAHIEDGKLVADREETKEIIDQLGSEPEHVYADIFRAKPRPNIPEKDKPTQAQQEAREENIRKAQEAAQGAQQYENRSLDELRDLASERDIKNYADYDKHELINALRESA